MEEAFSEHQPEDFDLKLDDDFVIATYGTSFSFSIGILTETSSFMVPDDSTLEELQEVELPDIVVHIEITSLDD